MSNSKENIDIQREKVFKSSPLVSLVSPCKIGDGIIQLKSNEEDEYIAFFDNQANDISYFIPASGSGSRMFQFIFDYLSKNKSSDEINLLINSIDKFAFFNKFDDEIQNQIKNNKLDKQEILSLIINKSGLNLAALPKGLIPFHNVKEKALNPFQEQILQGLALNKNAKFHFTIQEDFEKEIRESIAELNIDLKSVDFSYQDKKTNSFAFKLNGEVLLSEKKNPVTRPAGHGALIHNLNEINSEYIFIKNIDNIQHFDKKNDALKTWKVLSGVLMQFKEDARNVLKNPSIESLKQLNKKYKFCSEKNVQKITGLEGIKTILNRPSRICGMVKNEGLPGGGPFWTKQNNTISKQIIEKAQISDNPEQVSILNESSHFNPVLIVASPCDMDGNKLDLKEFVDNKSYFIVDKNQEGQDIKYMELPGLWNGAMSNWNTIFIEVSSNSFSPVKSITDLLKPLHNNS